MKIALKRAALFGVKELALYLVTFGQEVYEIFSVAQPDNFSQLPQTDMEFARFQSLDLADRNICGFCDQRRRFPATNFMQTFTKPFQRPGVWAWFKVKGKTRSPRGF